jgi:hypothetical protein
METTTSHNSNNKRKRGADARSSELAVGAVSSKKPRLDDAAPASNFLTCVELGDALFFMVAFLEPSERWKLAEVCRSACRLVENYSQGAPVKLAQEHKVDEGFFNRLRENRTPRPRILEYQQREGGDLPHRYLLEKSKGTYLYKLEMMPGVHGVSGGVAVSTGAGGSHLVVAGTQQLGRRPPFGDPGWPPISIYFWDVIERRLLHRFDVPAEGREYSIEAIFLMADNRRIVACTNRRVLVFSSRGIASHLQPVDVH